MKLIIMEKMSDVESVLEFPHGMHILSSSQEKVRKGESWCGWWGCVLPLIILALVRC